MRSKFESYIGFAAKSGNLIAGTAACASKIEKRKAKLLLIAEDTAERTLEKLRNIAEKANVPVRIYGDAYDLSKMIGKPGRNVFVITDEKFAKIIVEQIDAKKEEVLG
ncbi:MAG: ribosomal L7Ae/L30e/S12e/Gadd45 family protein [Eubacteriales bacterium]|nr:ribosomal L7Ae/L30e/S12e/Gadd45 family protein [Eubacteriales bacterium]MDD4389804.1 ribosomal L7Ae/L30e/S12e/Gadd45 family protein [Eubacteriales bacterium]